MCVVNSNYIFDPYWSSCGIIYFRWLIISICFIYNNLRPAWKTANESWYLNSKQAICPTMLNCISRLRYCIELNGPDLISLYQCKVGQVHKYDNFGQNMWHISNLIKIW